MMLCKPLGLMANCRSKGFNFFSTTFDSRHARPDLDTNSSPSSLEPMNTRRYSASCAEIANPYIQHESCPDQGYPCEHGAAHRIGVCDVHVEAGYQKGSVRFI